MKIKSRQQNQVAVAVVPVEPVHLPLEELHLHQEVLLQHQEVVHLHQAEDRAKVVGIIRNRKKLQIKLPRTIISKQKLVEEVKRKGAKREEVRKEGGEP
jgi:hypothetical protein